MNPKPKTPKTYVIHTSAEVDALERAAADGAHGRNYDNDETRQARIHRVPGHSHYVQIQLSSEELTQGVVVGTLERITAAQDADSIFAFLYISQLLAPDSPQTVDVLKRVDIDLDDVVAKIGWDPRSTKERLAMRRRIWQLIYFGDRAEVIGKRKGKYTDRVTGQEIDTEIHSSPWRILEREKATQPSLFAEEDVPLRVELAVSKDWAKLLASPQTAQYLPLGELLGAIKGSKPSGAWARVLGLALANFWRREPKAAIAGTIRPTRRELLERFPPKTGAVTEVLNSQHPRRALEYWVGALGILAAEGFIDESGEATRTLDEIKEQYPGYEWADEWLDEPVLIVPGAAMRGHIEGRAVVVPEKKKPRGRPRKSAS